jgi:hypothetical protein
MEGVMKSLGKFMFAPIAAACDAMSAKPVTAGAADAGTVNAFVQLGGTMTGRDTGSGWFVYYVSALNLQIDDQEGTLAYGAAGPSGPLDGFSGYVSGFMVPDTGSMRFNNYVDAVNFVIQEKQ